MRKVTSRKQATRLGNAALGPLLAVLLGGCSLATGAKVVDLYDISAPDLSGAVSGGTRAQVLVPEPTAVQALNTNQIAIRTGDATLGYIAGGQWADSLPRLIQARVVETLEETDRVGAVGTPGEGLFINYSLRLTIREFGIQANGGRLARVEIAARILNESNGRVLASRSFEQSVSAGAGTEGAVRALDAAFGNAARDLVQWVFSRI